MKRVRFSLLFAAGVAVAASSSFAGEGDLQTQFWGWLGKNQRGYFLDGSNWHYCFNNVGGSCGSVALTTGRSQCINTGFNVGGKWAIPTRIGGMEINASANRSWSACNIRSETVTCSPNPGWKGRAVINFSERWGRVRVLGGETYITMNSSCPAGWTSDWMGGSRFRCRYTGGAYSVDGYLPEWRGSSCDYARI